MLPPENSSGIDLTEEERTFSARTNSTFLYAMPEDKDIVASKVVTLKKRLVETASAARGRTKKPSSRVLQGLTSKNKQNFSLLFYNGSLDRDTKRPGLKLLVGEQNLLALHNDQT